MNDVLDYFKQLFHEGDTVVVACSGGPDSMCLLNLLCEFKKDFNIQIIVAHVNHKLRRESEEEAEFVKTFASENNLIYEYMEILEYHHDNLENEARKRRYDFFSQLVSKYHVKYLMTAHHGDDLMETILMRIARGSSLQGYSGFQKNLDMGSYKIIRPLIAITKDDIIKYMDENHYIYFIDKSNYSKEYTRNRYRMEVLPFLKNENPLVHLKFLKFSRELQKANTFINSYIKKIIPTLKEKGGYSIKKLRELDLFVLEKVIEYEFSLIYTNDLFLVRDQNKKVLIDLIYNDKSSGVIHLPNDYLAVKEYDILKIVYNKECDQYDYILDREITLPCGIIKVIPNSNLKSNYVIRLNSNEIELPIHIRTRMRGDKMEVKNLNGSKKVKDIFIDEKISKVRRDGLPIVTDNKNQILWIPGVKKSKFDVERDGIYDIILSYEEEYDE